MKIAVDIDGVLADVRKYVREHLFERRDWAGYFNCTEAFPVIAPMRQLLRTLMVAGHDLRLVTGRPESNRKPTMRWLTNNVVGSWYDYDLLMRANGDSRPGSEVKLDVYKMWRPDLIIDDDPAVVKAATKAGFVVLQVHGFRVTDRVTDTNMVPNDRED